MTPFNHALLVLGILEIIYLNDWVEVRENSENQAVKVEGIHLDW